jgi:hypothetical protein
MKLDCSKQRDIQPAFSGPRDLQGNRFISAAFSW